MHLGRKEVADLLLGRTTKLDSGEVAVPIDQDEGSVARDEFYQVVVGKNPG